MTSEHSDELARGATLGGLPVSPSMAPSLAAARVRSHARPFARRDVAISLLAVSVALLAAVVAKGLGRLIDVCTNLAFFGRLSTAHVAPREHALGWAVLFVPAVGGLIVGVMARYGSQAIRGHGIPEAMERVLLHDSRIPARMTFLKPLSAAIAIGTGGPFGAEGPIIATGGALGSLIGQLLSTSARERRTLLAAGAAAGMAATFGAPVSAVLLAIELLLFELSPRSVVPVALATATATAARMALGDVAAVFPMPELAAPSSAAHVTYALIGALLGVGSVLVTRLVYAIEAAFERLPLHFMWWPALGGLVVGAVGIADPRVLGVGYDNIESIVAGDLLTTSLVSLCVFKLVAWSLSLGSGTSGGTLAPLFTIGGALGALLAMALSRISPELGLDVRIAGVVGMAAIFAGASRALLASVVFAFETTRQPVVLLPLLAGCATSYLVSCLLMRHSIMTRKIAARGVVVPAEYGSDPLERIRVASCATRPVVTLQSKLTLAEARTFLASGSAERRHQGYPVVGDDGMLVRVVTRREIFGAQTSPDTRLTELLTRVPICVFEDSPLRDALELMLREDVGRLPVVRRDAPRVAVAMITRSDVLRAFRSKLDEHRIQPGHAASFARKLQVAPRRA